MEPTPPPPHWPQRNQQTAAKRTGDISPTAAGSVCCLGLHALPTLVAYQHFHNASASHAARFLRFRFCSILGNFLCTLTPSSTSSLHGQPDIFIAQPPTRLSRPTRPRDAITATTHTSYTQATHDRPTTWPRPTPQASPRPPSTPSPSPPAPPTPRAAASSA